MSDTSRKALLDVLAPVAKANTASSDAIQRLALAAQQTDDPDELRRLILDAGKDVVSAAGTINEALKQAVGTR